MTVRRETTVVLSAFLLSGAAALIYEVAWTRALSLILGSTTYALSTMLSTFMTGLALGAVIGGRLADRGKNLLLLLGVMEFGIGVFGLITIPLIHSLPPVYFAVHRAFHLSPGLFFLFQFLLCASIMLIPTTLMGATFPIVSKKVTTSMQEMGKWVGNAYSFNTIGAIGGSFAAGFILIPVFGVKIAAVIGAILNITVSIAVIALSRARLKGALAGLFALFFAGALAAALGSDEDRWPVNYYSALRFDDYAKWAEENRDIPVLFDKDYREGRVRLWRDAMGFYVIQIGGKVEGTTLEDLANTLLLSYLPIASHPNPQSFLTIGLGVGMTLSAAKGLVNDVSLVEINQGVIDAMTAHGPPGLLNDVKVTVNDARNYLLLTDRNFDIISSEPSYPTESSVVSLFTKEFYEIAATKLTPGGIYCQWLPYYQLSNDDVTTMLRTFGSVFEYVYLWKVQTSLDLILVGSSKPFRLGTQEIQERAQGFLKSRGLPLFFTLSRDPDQVRKIVQERSDIPLNTDDRPLIEFHAARNLITGVKD